MSDGLLLLDDDVLMIAHLLVDMDREALRRVEAFKDASLQKSITSSEVSPSFFPEWEIVMRIHSESCEVFGDLRR